MGSLRREYLVEAIMSLETVEPVAKFSRHACHGLLFVILSGCCRERPERCDMIKKKNHRVTRTAAEEAVRTLLTWAGDDPMREGLRDTPKRVVNAYGDWFSGYSIDPGAYLRRTFEEVGGSDKR